MFRVGIFIMKLLMCIFIGLTVLATNFLIDYVRANYQFQVENIQSIEKSFRITYRGKYSEHPFAEMKSRIRDQLCLAAQEYFSLETDDAMSDEYIVFEAEVWVIKYFESETERREIAIDCRTNPSSYLRLRDSKNPNGLNVMLIQDIAERYQFKLEFAESVTQVEITSANEPNEGETGKTGLEDILEDELSFWTGRDHMNLCVAAQKYVQNLIFFPNDVAHNPQIYEFQYTKEKSRKYVAIKCPASSDLYIRLGEEQNQVKIVLLKADRSLV